MTYGGFIINSKVTVSDLIEVLDAVNYYLKEKGIVKVIYKAIPYIYHKLPAQEDLYALFRIPGCRLIARNISSTIFLSNKVKFIESRRSGIRKALKNEIRIEESDHLELFWDILNTNLKNRYGVRPVHTLQEMQLLKSRFPENIVLYLAFQGERAIGGTLLYLMGHIVHTQYISASLEGKEVGALDLLFDYLINTQYATCEYFDFGQSTENNGECHLVNPKEGMYKDFLSILKCKVLGLTATPYRLSSSQDFGSMLKFITRTRPAIFKEVIYHVQVSTLLDMGFLSKLNYYPMNPMGWNELNLKVNTTGADYTDKSVQREYERIDFYSYLVHIVHRLMNPIQGGKRKGILVFTHFLKEAERLTWSIPGCVIVSGETPKKEREQILEAFKSGEIPVVANVGVLTTGFDYPELDTIVMARPTMSLAMWYQIVGRAIRPHPSKEAGWVIDLCGNVKRFGEVKDLRLVDGGNGKWAVWSKSRQLTNIYF